MTPVRSSRRPQIRRAGVLASVVALLLTAACTTQSASTGATPLTSAAFITLVTVKTNPAVVSGQSAQVTATAPASASVVTGIVNSRPVSFTKRGALWVATLTRGSQLRPGIDLLQVMAGPSGSSGEAFANIPVLGAPAAVGLALRAAGSQASPAVTVGLGQPVASLVTTVNGAVLTPPLKPGRPLQVQSLGVAEGLHHGTNDIRVTAITAQGGWQTAGTQVVVGAAQPIAEAGPDSTGRVGVASHLNGFQSVPAVGRPASTLSYRWTIVRAPAGSRAGLVRPTTVRPTFTPDVAGTYVFRLTTSEPGGTASSDTVTLNAQGYVPPAGMLIQTESARQPATYSITSGGAVVESISPAAAGASMVAVYDRVTLEPLVTASAGADPAQVQTNEVGPIQAAGDGPSGEGIVAVVTVAGGNGGPAAPVLNALGVQEDANMTAGNTFSVVVVTGGTKPLVWRSSNDSAIDPPGAPVGPGNLSGYLQPTNGGVGPYTFVPETHLPFDTSSASTPLSNQMTIGCSGTPGTPCLTPSSTPLAACSGAVSPGGVQVVVAPVNLSTATSRTFTTNDGCTGPNDAAGDTAAVEGIMQLLAQYPANKDGTVDQLVMVQSIGTPRNVSTSAQSGNWAALTAAWLQLALALVPYGGTASVFADIGSIPHQGYALVGSTALQLTGSSPSSAQEASSDNPNGSPARLTGLLTRDRRDDLVPLVSAVGGAIDNVLGTTLYQPASPWPYSSTPGEQAALAYVTTTTGPGLSTPVYPSSGGECYDPAHPSFRDAYCNTGIDWNQVSRDLSSLVGHPPTGPGTFGITRAGWNKVVKELAKETNELTDVTNLIAFLQDPFLKGSQGVDLNQIIAEVQQSLTPPATPASSTSTWLGIIGEFFGALWAVLPEPASNVMGVVSEGFALGSTLSTGSDGQPLLSDPVQVDADQLGSQLTQRYQQASQNIVFLRDVIVTDSAKLGAAATTVEQSGLTPVALNRQEDALKVASKGWLTSELLGSLFHPDLLAVANPNGPEGAKAAPYAGDASAFVCNQTIPITVPPYDVVSPYHPFAGALPAQQYDTVAPGPSAGSAVPSTYVLAAPGSVSDFSESVTRLPLAPTTVLDQLFGPVHLGDSNSQGLGVSKAQFYGQTLGLASGTTQACQTQPSIDGPLAAVSPSDGQQTVFFTGTYGTDPGYRLRSVTGATFSALTGTWASLPVMPGSPDSGTALAAASNGPGDLHLFYLQGGRLNNVWYDPGSGWQGPAGLPGNPDGGTPLAATSTGPGEMQVFFRSNRQLQMDTWSVASGWQGPTALPGSPDGGSGLAAVGQPGSVPDRLFFSTGGTLSAISQVPPAGWQPPVELVGPDLCGQSQCAG